jgi:hypothetical protein
MLDTRYHTLSKQTGPLLLFLLSISFASCASQGNSPIRKGETRLAGGSGGLAYVAWDDDAVDDDGDTVLSQVATELRIQGGTMMSDQLELGFLADIGLGLGSTDASDDSFSFALNPGMYGRYYFSELGTGVTPWLGVSAIALNAVQTGYYDDDDDTIFLGVISTGMSTFISDHLALEFELFLGAYATDGTDEGWADITDLEAFLISVGLSFYY